MKRQKLFEIRNIFLLLTTVCGSFLCLLYADECTNGVKNGLLFCLEVLMPSLFLFMALSAYIVKSGVALRLAKPLGGVSRALFRLPPAGASALLLCMIGGYPVGAQCAALLYEQGQLRQSEAQKTAYIAVCAGPGFLLNYVGSALLNNRKAGLILLLSQIIGLLITGVIIGRAVPSEGSKKKESRMNPPDGNLLVASVADASRAACRMCGMVVLCAAMIEIIQTVSPNEMLTDIASALTEITTGCQRMCGRYPLYMIAFFIGFGGVAVHLQVYAGLGSLCVNKLLFFFYRIIQGIFTAAAAYIFLMIFPVEQRVFSSVTAPLTAAKSATLAGSAALVFASLCFTGSVHQRKKR